MSDPTNLAKLRDSRPPQAVVRRIVDGALERAQPTPRTWSPLLSVGAPTFALALIAVGLFFRLSTPLAPPSEPGRGIVPPPAPTASLATGASGQADGAQVTVRAGRHQIRLAPHSRVLAVRVEAHATELRLDTGSAQFQVQPLAAEEVFRVLAPGLSVEAVGTEFEVALEGPCARVTVSEGTVRIQREGRPVELLPRGERRSYCDAPQETLSEEERLVSAAMDAVRAGTPADQERAVGLLTRYTEQHPQGAYQEEALYYLARLTHRLGRPVDSQRWTAQFLERFPKGRRAEELRALGR